jgi:hypothetical protein
VLHRLQRSEDAFQSLVTLSRETPQGLPLAAPLLLGGGRQQPHH